MRRRELYMQGAVLIQQRQRQIAALKAELVSLAHKNRAQKTATRAELMGSAWFRLNEAVYMLGLLQHAMRKLKK